MTHAVCNVRIGPRDNTDRARDTRDPSVALTSVRFAQSRALPQDVNHHQILLSTSAEFFEPKAMVLHTAALIVARLPMSVM